MGRHHQIACNPSDHSPLYCQGYGIHKVECCFPSLDKNDLNKLLNTHNVTSGFHRFEWPTKVDVVSDKQSPPNGVIKIVLQAFGAAVADKPEESGFFYRTAVVQSKLCGGGQVLIFLREGKQSNTDQQGPVSSEKKRNSIELELYADEDSKAYVPLPTTSKVTQFSDTLPFSFRTTLHVSSAPNKSSCVQTLDNFLCNGGLVGSIRSTVCVSSLSTSRAEEILSKSGYAQHCIWPEPHVLTQICLPRLDQEAYTAKDVSNNMKIKSLLLHDLSDWLGAVACRLFQVLRRRIDDDMYASEYRVPSYLAYESNVAVQVLTWNCDGLIAESLVEQLVKIAKETVEQPKSGIPFVAVTAWSSFIGRRHLSTALAMSHESSTAVFVPTSSDCVVPIGGPWC